MERKDIERLMRQISDWLASGEENRSLTLSVRKTGRPDDFTVGYDSGSVGLLMLMIASDDRLLELAGMSLAKKYASLPEEKRVSWISGFERMCESAADHMDSAREGGCALRMDIRTDGIKN